MEAQSQEVADENGNTAQVWKGMLTKLFSDLNLSAPYYTAVTRALKNMGCVKQLQRGGGTSPSEWWLLYEPTWELWLAKSDVSAPSNMRMGSRNFRDSVKQQILALDQRITEVEDRLDELFEALNLMSEKSND